MTVSNLARHRLRNVYIERCRERVGMAGDSLALAMRIICCATENLDTTRELRALLELQQEDGGWPDGWFYKYGSSGVCIANRGLTTALAIKAVEVSRNKSNPIFLLPQHGITHCHGCGQSM